MYENNRKVNLFFKLLNIAMETEVDTSWDFKDCRLENNGLIPKTCGFNKSFNHLALV